MPLTDVETIVRLTKIVVRGSSVTQAQISAFGCRDDEEPTESRTIPPRCRYSSHSRPPMQMAFSSGLSMVEFFATTMLIFIESTLVPANVCA